MSVSAEATPSAPISAFSHVQLLVGDVPASERWYTTALGLSRLTAADDGSYVALRHPSSGVVVVLSTRPDGAAGEESSLDHLAFGVADLPSLQRWADHLTNIGIDHPGVVPEGNNVSLQLRDPDGISIELVTRRPT